jgi:hypothetical protein
MNTYHISKGISKNKLPLFFRMIINKINGI